MNQIKTDFDEKYNFFFFSRLSNYFDLETVFMADWMPTTSIYSQSASQLRLRDESLSFSFSIETSYPKTPPQMTFHEGKEWHRLKCGQSRYEKDCPVLYCGGRILAMEWAPFPSEYDDDEILAITVHSDVEYSVRTRGPTESVQCFIQIWSISKNGHAKLLYAIDCLDGPVMSIAFCPSGGYVANKRLGLLAATKYDGKVDVLALPTIDAENETTNAEEIHLVRNAVVLSLRLTLSNEQRSACTKLCWSQSKGHAVIAGGFSSGLIAIWDLNNIKFAHLHKVIDSCPVLLPSQTFYSALSYITRKPVKHYHQFFY